MWQKDSHDDRLHKFLVLIGLEESPAMVWTLLPEETKEISVEFQNALRGTGGRQWRVK